VNQTAADVGAMGEVSVRNSAVRSITGSDVEIEQSAIRELHGEEVEIEQSALVFATAERLRVQSSSAVALVGREVEAREVNTIFLLSPRVRGTVRTVFDMRAAFAFGLGIVLGRQLLRLFRTD
jgi:ribosomal protein L14